MSPAFPAAVLLACLLAAPAAAQKLCQSRNEHPAPTYPPPSFGATWFALRITAPRAMEVTGLEFHLRATDPHPSAAIGVFDEDATTGRPRAMVASGHVRPVSGVPGWYGAPVAPPVQVAANQDFFAAVMLSDTVRAGMNPDPSAPIVIHYWSRSGAWSGPHATQRWMYRIHCGTHAGLFTSYGLAKQGTGGRAPALTGWTFPNTTNPISLRLSDAPGGAPSVLLWGLRANTLLPVGTLHVSPVLLATAGTTAAGGWLGTDLVLPNDPALAGARVAFQAWVLDPGAAQGLTHSMGLEARLGH